jgi:hypothetical protein
MKKAGALLIGLMTFVFGFGQTGTNVVISQVYGGGGNSGSIYTNDFIELFNPTASAISLNGWSVQYNSATGTGTWQVTNLTNFTMQPGQYYLVQQSQGTGGTTPLPTPNATGTIAMSGTAGKVALVNNTTALSGACPAGLIDEVGFGVTANCFEGAAAATAPSNSNSIIRASNGCTDANNNSADFASVLAAPRNSASPFNVCGGGMPTVTVTGTINDFGTVTLGNSSTSQSVTVSGTNLTPASGNISVAISPLPHFSVSTDNVNFFSSVTLPYSSNTLAATLVYVKYNPGATGLHNSSLSISGGGIASPVLLSLTGNCIPSPTPTLTASSPNPFPNTCINTTAGPNTFLVQGTNLNNTAVTVGPMNGYTFSTAAAGTYTNSLSITQPGGSFSQNIFVTFTPIAAISYSGPMPIAGGGASAISTSLSGVGVNSVPTAIIGGASAITTTTATCAGSISNDGCTSVIEYGIEYSLTNGFTPGTGTKIISTNISGGAFTSALSGLQPTTTYYYRSYATNGGGTGYSTQSSFNTASPTLTATALTAFGSVCLNSPAGPNSFTLTGIGLTTANVNISALNGYSYSTTSGGIYSASLSLTQPGGNYTQTIFVKFTPTNTIAYNGNIQVSGGASLPFNVAASGTGINTPATVITSAVTGLLPNKATLGGSITSISCSPITSYGIEFSSINNFTNGRGQKITGTNLLGTDFSATAEGLFPNTTYYYKAFTVNNAGTSYSAQQSFTTSSLLAGMVIYNNPATRGGSLRFTITGVTPGHYAVQVFNRMAQLVYQKDMILSLNHIDETIKLPGKLPPGIYTLQVGTVDKVMKKVFVVQ